MTHIVSEVKMLTYSKREMYRETLHLSILIKGLNPVKDPVTVSDSHSRKGGTDVCEPNRSYYSTYVFQSDIINKAI